MGNLHYIVYIDKNNDEKYDIRTEIETIGLKNRAPGAKTTNFSTLNEAFMSISGTIEGNDSIKCTTITIGCTGRQKCRHTEQGYKCAIYKKGMLWQGRVNGELIVSTPFRWLTLFIIKYHVKDLKRSASFTL